MKRRVLSLLVVVVLGAPGAASAQSSPPLNCSNLPQTAELRIVRGYEGKPITLNAGGGFYPGCDNFTDTYVVNISWGDGTSSQPTLYAGAQQGVFQFSEKHTYAAPGRYGINYTQTNQRTGVSRTDSHYVAEIASDNATQKAPLKVRAGVGFSGVVASFRPDSSFFFANNLSVRIAWGDGKKSAGTIDQNENGAYEIRGRHTWKKPFRKKRKLVATITEPPAINSPGGTITLTRPLKVAPG